MTPTSGALTVMVRSAAAAAARRYVGLAVGAFAGSELAVHGVGRANRQGDVPTAETLFQIGSVTKVFTALALADAVARHELTLDTPLGSLLPGVPAARNGAEITLGHLASHTSGLPRLPPGLRRQAIHHRRDPYREFTTGDLLAAIAATRPRPQPGMKVRYSSFGAALLGEALGRHAGMSFERRIAERVTGPLGLADTVVRPRPDQQPGCADGHARRGRQVPDWDMGGMPAAGALRSTVHDLLRLLRAHVEPELTALPEALRLVQLPRARANRWVRIGLGWHLLPVRGTGQTALWHNGAVGGSAACVAFLPEVRAGVVVLTNTGRSVDRLGIRLLQRLARSSAS